MAQSPKPAMKYSPSHCLLYLPVATQITRPLLSKPTSTPRRRIHEIWLAFSQRLTQHSSFYFLAKASSKQRIHRPERSREFVFHLPYPAWIEPGSSSQPPVSPLRPEYKVSTRR